MVDYIIINSLNGETELKYKTLDKYKILSEYEISDNVFVRIDGLSFSVLRIDWIVYKRNRKINKIIL